jgi:uncharacterized membrane protein HdeD (DUF308 family)
MSNNIFDSARTRLRAGLTELNRKWGWYLAAGILLVILGVIACSMAITATLVTVAALGWIMLVAGAALIALSFFTGRWSGFLTTLGLGALIAITGLAMLSSPLSGAEAITLLVATILLGTGIYRVAASIVMHLPNWGWSLLSGIVACVLGVLLLNRWPVVSLYFLGVYVGLDLIIHGFSWVMFSLRVHQLARAVDIGGESERRAA